MTIDTHEIAWSAGFFDGEGCFTNGKNNVPVIHISQKCDLVLKRFQAIFNVGHLNGPYIRNSSLIYRYNVTNFEDTQFVIAMLWKFLSPIKKQQASKVMNLYMERPSVKSQGWQNKRYDEQIRMMRGVSIG